MSNVQILEFTKANIYIGTEQLLEYFVNSYPPMKNPNKTNKF